MEYISFFIIIIDLQYILELNMIKYVFKINIIL